MDICLPVLKESNKSRFDSNSVKNSVLNISHITFRDSRVHNFSDNLSRNSCIKGFFVTFRVLMVSSTAAGVIVQIIDVLAFPPSEDCKIRVSLESRNGMKLKKATCKCDRLQ